VTTHAAVSEHDAPWRVLMLTPSGHVEVVEVRSASESLALDTVQEWKPILGGGKPVPRPLPDPAVSPAGAFPGWPDASARQAGPARARTGRDGLGERF